MSDGKLVDDETKNESKEPVDDLVISHHTLRTTAGEITYTARTGRIVLREEEVKDDEFKGWKARAELSVTAYTLDDADVTERPISFVFNGGTPGAAQLHVARTVVRRAERAAWAAYDEHGEAMNKLAITYLNRLSDLLFILARYANREQGDVLWVPGGERGDQRQKGDA